MTAVPASEWNGVSRAPLVIQEQGSFAVGGTAVRSSGINDPARPGPEGQTLHGDHARVFYQVPANPSKLPLAWWHGFAPGSDGDADDGGGRDAEARRTGVRGVVLMGRWGTVRR
jgi:hypothetical protein